MSKQKDRVIIDTNSLISFFLIKRSAAFDNLIANGQIVLLFSEELFEELISFIQRPKFKKYFASEDIEALLQMLELRSRLIKVISKVILCRDPKDNFLLALAKDGKATHLITGDKDLLTLRTYKQTLILTLSEYLTSY